MSEESAFDGWIWKDELGELRGYVDERWLEHTKDLLRERMGEVKAILRRLPDYRTILDARFKLWMKMMPSSVGFRTTKTTRGWEYDRRVRLMTAPRQRYADHAMDAKRYGVEVTWQRDCLFLMDVLDPLENLSFPDAFPGWLPGGVWDDELRDVEDYLARHEARLAEVKAALRGCLNERELEVVWRLFG